MRLTNKMGLPDPIVEAVRNDGYSKGNADISVTELIAPPRQVALKRDHSEEITEDASDRIWSLVGQSIHTILERANRTGIAERRLSVEVQGWVVSGGVDLVNQDGVLSDYKVVTAWKLKGGKAPPEFEAQLNIYCEILRQNSEGVKSLQIVAILRDFSKLEAARDPEYPQSQVVIIPVPIWPVEKAQKFIKDRVTLHQQAQMKWTVWDETGFTTGRYATRADAERAAQEENELARKLGHTESYGVQLSGPPLCTMEERWGKPDTFAVMKQGGKRSLKNHESEEEALSHASQVGGYVEKRQGDSTRCRHYCSAAPFCSQWRAIQESAQPEDWKALRVIGQDAKKA